MTNLQLIKSERFGEIEADIYSNGNDMFMTIDQLAACLGYASKSGIENIIGRNEYLKAVEFSTTHRLGVVEGGRTVSLLQNRPPDRQLRRRGRLGGGEMAEIHRNHLGCGKVGGKWPPDGP